MVYFIIFASLKDFKFAKIVVTPFRFLKRGTNRKKKKTALEVRFGNVLHSQRMHCYIYLIEVYKHTCCVLDVMPLLPVFCLSC